MVYVPPPIGNAGLGIMSLQIALTFVGICLFMVIIVLANRYWHNHPDPKWQAKIKAREDEMMAAQVEAEDERFKAQVAHDLAKKKS